MVMGTVLLVIIALAAILRASAFMRPFRALNSGTSIRASSRLYWKVTIKHEGKETELEVSENTSILEAALEANIDLPHDCDLGVCLTCPAFIESGECDQSGGTLDDSVAEKGYALTCQSFPRSDVVIRSIEEDELVDAQFEGGI